ncbi:MAG: polyprenol monophosphomannose synthase [bacterium]
MGDALVVLPTYNERGNIAAVLEGVLAQGERFEALVVDDQSPDGTADAVREKFGTNPRAHLLVRSGPRGRGLAGAEGFRWAIERKYDYIIEMDADGSHDPATLPALLEALGRADVAIASRLVPGGGEEGRGIARRWITKAANAYLRLALGLKVRDCTTGYRGFRRSALEAVPWDRIRAAGPAIVQEILYAVAVRGFSIEEIPFVFRERDWGKSKLRIGMLLAGLADAALMRKRLDAKPGEGKTL